MSTLAPTQQHTQDKLVELFTQCDVGYAKRVLDGLTKYKAMKNSGNSNGTSYHNRAVQEVITESMEAKAY